MTQAEISRALVADWLPTLSVAVSRSVLGWPSQLLGVEQRANHPYLILRSVTGWSDRQWKVVLSWMLGIAGTRRILREERYIWIAPCSAFYPNRRQPVATPDWHQDYPPSILTIEIDPQNGSRLRPDYIVARDSPGGNIDFALVESKGTSYSLNRLGVCPPDWARQARNAIVKVNNARIPIPRHLRVATRSNPNGVRERSRRFQVRAWNSRSLRELDRQDMLVEVMAAHYSGLCKNLGLRFNLKSLKLAVFARLTRNMGQTPPVNKISPEADTELKRGGWNPFEEVDAHFPIETEIGTINVVLSREAISLMRAIQSGFSKQELHGMMREKTVELTEWYSRMTDQFKDFPNISVDRSGFLVNTEGIDVTNMGERKPAKLDKRL